MSPVRAGVLAGAVIALTVGLMAKINFDYGAPWASTHQLVVQVSSSDAMSGGSDVRIAGRIVGQVVSTQSEGNYSNVVVKVDSEDWPLPQDSTASVRLGTLLGAKYIQLQPGKSSGSLADGATIPVDRTQPVVDFDQVLDTFNTPTQDSLTGLLKTLGAPNRGALAEQEGQLQQLIPDLAQLSKAGVTGTAELAHRDQQVNGILNDLAVTSTTLASSANDLAGTIDSLNSITGALATHTQALEGFIANTDAVNQTANQVLAKGGASEFNAGLQQFGPLSTNFNQLLAELIPQTASYCGQLCNANDKSNTLQAGLDLVYEIGAATSQSDASGFFLRQNPKGIDLSGLLPIPGAAAVPASPGPAAAAPSLPLLPSLPSLPSLPPLPSLPIPGQCASVPAAQQPACIVQAECGSLPASQQQTCIAQTVCRTATATELPGCVAQYLSLLQPQPAPATTTTTSGSCIAFICLGSDQADPQQEIASYALWDGWESWS